MAEHPNFVNLNGTWFEIEDRLFTIFSDFFDDNELANYDGAKITYNSQISKKRPEGYWHVTHRDSKNLAGATERIFDTERSRRIGWIKSLVHGECANCKIFWDQRHDKLHFWLEDDDYILILADQKRRRHGTRFLNLVTAFYIDGNGYKRRFAKMYRSYEKTRAA